MRGRSLMSPLVTLLLLAPLAAQETCLRPEPDGTSTLQVDLQPLAKSSAPTGPAALLAVPGFDALLQALRTRGQDILGEFSDLGHTVSPTAPRLRLSRIDLQTLQRATMVSYPARPGVVATLLDFEPAQAAATAELFDAAVAEVQRTGSCQQDAPWPQARRLFTGDGARDAWIAVRGCQLISAIGKAGFELQPTRNATGGLRIDMLAAPGGTPRAQRAMRAITRLLGFAATPQECYRLRIDGDGFDETLCYLGKRTEATPPRPLTAAPALPRLDGQFVMLRANADPTWLAGLLDAYAADYLAGFDLEPYREILRHATGALSLGISAPALGSLYPRLTLAMRVQDGAGVMAGLRRRAEGGDWPALRIEDLSGVSSAVLTLPGTPAAIRPSLCLVDDVLLLCESPATLRVVRRSMGKGDDVFADREARSCAAPTGSTQLGEAWFDCDTIYRRAAKLWGTSAITLAFAPDVGDTLWQAPGLIAAEDLPEAEDVAATLGRGHAVLYAGADEVGMRVAAPTLGPVLSGALAVGMPLLPKVLPMALEVRLRQQRVRAAEARAIRLGQALRQYRAAHADALPDKVTALVPLLPPGDDSPLQAPHDPAALKKAATLRDGSEVELRCSFQRAPDGMTAGAALPAMPGTNPQPGQELPDRRARPVFAFCSAGYRGRHLVILTTGEVIWIHSEALLDAVIPQKR